MARHTRRRPPQRTGQRPGQGQRPGGGPRRGASRQARLEAKQQQRTKQLARAGDNKEQAIEFDGVIVEALPNTMFGSDLEGEVFESWSALATLLARTERIRGGILVSCVMWRQPAILAKSASTIDVASDGRLEFGIGACWNAWESDLYGVRFPPLPER